MWKAVELKKRKGKCFGRIFCQTIPKQGKIKVNFQAVKFRFAHPSVILAALYQAAMRGVGRCPSPVHIE